MHGHSGSTYDWSNYGKDIYLGLERTIMVNNTSYGVEHKHDVDEGWHKILDMLFDRIRIHCVETNQPLPMISQIKEKFGGLRVYTEGHDNIINAFIRDAEEESYETCELCGKPGKLRQVGWMKTLCKKHWLSDLKNFTPERQELIKKAFVTVWKETIY